MKILIVAHYAPMPDRQADSVRLFQILRLLSAKHHIDFFRRDTVRQVRMYGADQTAQYDKALADLGITVIPGPWANIRRSEYDAVVFEYYTIASYYLADVRCWSPKAKIIVDTVDLAFLRLHSRARTSGSKEDADEARKTKREELAVYRNADLVITVSRAEQTTLQKELPHTATAVIPLVMHMPPLRAREHGSRRNLIFVGNFHFAANGDAMVFFCESVLPLIRRQTEVHLRIVGNNPPDAVKRFAGEDVEVMGFVPDIAAVYGQSDVAIAPITWGGGLKGKIAEAMSYGLPVVATSVGVDGFGLDAGREVLVADAPEAFAEHVVALLKDDALYDKIQFGGRTFAEAQFAPEQLEKSVHRIFDAVQSGTPKRLPIITELKTRVGDVLTRHILWRFQ